MGIHDRDYYRDGTNKWWTSAGDCRGVIALIALTVVGSVAALYGTPAARDAARHAPDGRAADADGPTADEYAYSPPDYVVLRWCDFHAPSVVPGGQVWRVLTSQFVSTAGLWGFVFGMFGLYFFGAEMEVLYGTRRFVTFYLMVGLVACGVKLLMALANMDRDAHTTGPSANLFAVFVLFAFHYPHRRIRLFWFLPVPVWLLVTISLGLYTLVSLASVMASGSLAHHLAEPLVGAGVGFLYYRTGGHLFGFVEDFRRWVRGLGRRRSTARLSVYDPPAAPRTPVPAAAPAPRQQAAADDEPSTPPAGVDEHLEAKLDAVLEKVAKSGKASLTPEENAVLVRASEIFKRRRG